MVLKRIYIHAHEDHSTYLREPKQTHWLSGEKDGPISRKEPSQYLARTQTEWARTMTTNVCARVSLTLYSTLLLSVTVGARTELWRKATLDT